MFNFRGGQRLLIANGKATSFIARFRYFRIFD